MRLVLGDAQSITGREDRSATRTARVQRKEAVIVRAARDIFLERGFKGTTMAHIARGSGVADGTLYTYFQNKEALARAVVADFYKRLTQSAQEGVDALSQIEDRLRFLARHHLVNVMAERRVLEMMPLIDMHSDDYEGSELFGLNKNYVVIFDRVVKNGQANGVIKPELTLWMLRDIFFGGLDYGCRTMMIKGRDGVDEFVEQMTSLILMEPGVIANAAEASLIQRLEKTADRLETLLQTNGNK